MADSDITSLFGSRDQASWSDAERAAFAKGYADYRQYGREGSLSILKPAFDAPAGYEPAYQAGWDKALEEDDEARRSAAIGLA